MELIFSNYLTDFSVDDYWGSSTKKRQTVCGEISWIQSEWINPFKKVALETIQLYLDLFMWNVWVLLKCKYKK